MIAVLLNLVYAALLLFYCRGWRRASRFNPAPAEDVMFPHVSVLIPVRNEAGNLDTIIASLRNQTYPPEKTEWIFINDHSDDDTIDLLQKLKDPGIRIIDMSGLPESGKKAALTAGVDQASGEWIITGDADCTMPDNWVSTLMSYAITKDVKMLCGLVKVKTDGSALNEFQAMETAVLQLCGAGSLAFGFPLLNTGASLAFHRRSFLTSGGYRKRQHIASGDDTFLMLDFNRNFPGKVMPVVHAGAMVETKPMPSFQDILRQRIRWNGKVRHYPLGYIHLVGFVVMAASIAFLGSLFLIFSDSVSLWQAAFVCAIRLLAESVVLKEWEKVSGQSFTPSGVLLMSVFYPLFTLFSFIIRPFISQKWKGRKL